jgi:hypothetical protein
MNLQSSKTKIALPVLPPFQDFASFATSLVLTQASLKSNKICILASFNKTHLTLERKIDKKSELLAGNISPVTLSQAVCFLQI